MPVSSVKSARVIARVCGFFACLLVAWASPAADQIKQLNAEALKLLRSDPQAAQAQANKALTLAREQRDLAGEAQARINLGSVERQRGHYDRAVAEFERAVAIANEADVPSVLASAEANLGITLDLGGLHAEALDAQGKALAIYEKAGNFGSASAVLINLGNSLAALGDHAAARAHYERALALKRSHDIHKGVGAVLNNLADLALEAGEVERAIALLDAAIAAHEQDGDRIGQGLALANRGVAKARSGQFDAALADIQSGEATARDLEHAVGISAALRARAELWLLRSRTLHGDARQLALANAEREARAALSGGGASDDPDRRRAAKRQLADVLAERGEAASAVALIDEIAREEHAVRQQQDATRMAIIRARYERQQADAELAMLRGRESLHAAEIETNRMWLRSAVGLGVALLAMLFALLRVARERRRHAELMTRHSASLQGALREKETQGQRAQVAVQANQRLLSLASEELQGALGEIRGLAERLLATAGEDRERTRALVLIARRADDLEAVVTHMRESVEAVESGECPTSLAQAVEWAMLELDARANQRRQHWQLSANREIRVPVGDRALKRLCVDLLDLALRHNRADGIIELRVHLRDDEAWLGISDHDGLLGELLQDPGRAGSRGLAAQRIVFMLMREQAARLGARFVFDEPGQIGGQRLHLAFKASSSA